MAEHLTENIKLRIDPETLSALERLAKAGDRSVAAEMRRAIRHHIRAHDRLEAEKVTP